MRYQRPKGTADILPGESAQWEAVEKLAREIFARYGYREIRTQIFLTLIECQFTLFQFTFNRLDLGIPCRYLFFQISFQVQKLFLYFQQLIFLDHFRFLFSLPQHGIVPRPSGATSK